MSTKKEQLIIALEQEYDTLPETSKWGESNHKDQYPLIIRYLKEGILPDRMSPAHNLFYAVIDDIECVYADYDIKYEVNLGSLFNLGLPTLGDPKEPTAYCTNCGKLCWQSDLWHTSRNMLSVLYNVCQKCADIHSNYIKK